MINERGTVNDFYKILGVAESANKDEIKKIYRKLALQYHPDRNKGEKAAEKKFKEISEAYYVLSDDKRRKEYDQMRKYGASGSAGFGNFRGTYSGDFNSIFEEILRGSSTRGSARTRGTGAFSDISDLFGGMGSRGEQARRGEDIETELTLNFFAAINGCHKDIQLRIERTCQNCQGSGVKKTLTKRTKCEFCNGRGLAKVLEKLKVTIPAGVTAGSIIRLRGKGHPGKNGGPEGNLLIQITVSEDTHFHRIGDDLFLDLPISLNEALMGGTVKIPTGSGEVSLKIPSSSTGNKKLRLQGKGVKNTKTGQKGDLTVSLKITLPEKMTEEAKNLLIQFIELTSYNPRNHWIT
jgi:molecular chaperone DnaJ